MREYCLKANDLTRECFLNLIRTLDSQASARFPRRAWIEAPDGWSFDWWHGMDGCSQWCRSGHQPVQQDSADCLAKSMAGRLFAPDGELRWRVIPALGDACFRTVFLGERDWVGTELKDRSGCLKELSPKETKLYLWGQQTEASKDEWIELRIPHRFRYPVQFDSRHVVVVAEVWRDSLGEPHFVRLRDLEPAKEDPSA